MAKISENCPFCKEHLFPYHISLGLSLSEAIIFSDQHVFVTPDLSPIGELHFLIIPHKHYCNYATAPKVVRESLYKAIRYIREKIYQCEDFILFEHGSTKVNYGGNSIDHAHVHIIKGKYDILSAIMEDSVFEKQFDNTSLDEYSTYHSELAYMWIMQGTHQSTFFTAKNPPSQYLREVFARLYSIGYCYDWKNHYHNEQSIQKYLKHVKIAKEFTIRKRPTYNRLRKIISEFKNLSDKELENSTIDKIMVSPYDLISDTDVKKLFGENYIPGLFYLSERGMRPSFLLQESEKFSYEEWLTIQSHKIILQFRKSPYLNKLICSYTETDLCTDLINILQFKNDAGYCFDQIVTNQVFSDVFYRIIMFLLTGNANYVYHIHKGFNDLGRCVALALLEHCKDLSLEKLLMYSIVTGVVGLNIKESLTSTSPCSLEGCFDLNPDFEKNNILDLHQNIMRRLSSDRFIGIDDSTLFVNRVLNDKTKQLVWITDDYIEGVLELKIIEQILERNPNISCTIVPRCNHYSNDLSCQDVKSLIDEKEFLILKRYFESGRFVVSDCGMDMSTIDGTRLSHEVYDNITDSDLVVITGARAFEMVQGINKDVFYSGIAVCKSYTETITGYPKESGKMVFLYCPSGQKAFENFKMRSTRTIISDGKRISVAEMTAKEYYDERKQFIN